MRVFFRKGWNYFRRICSNLFYLMSIDKYYMSSWINSPLKIDGPENIQIGYNSIIQYKTWLAALPLTGSHKCELKIGNGVRIGHFNHIYATRKIVIEDNVLTADKVYISDNLHGYKDTTIPILQQPILQNNSVTIGEGAWIGENVCILGVHIGKNSVIGANSVVTKDIPDYSVAVGSPAIIIKRYDFDCNRWRKTNKEGDFTD